MISRRRLMGGALGAGAMALLACTASPPPTGPTATPTPESARAPANVPPTATATPEPSTPTPAGLTLATPTSPTPSPVAPGTVVVEGAPPQVKLDEVTVYTPVTGSMIKGLASAFELANPKVVVKLVTSTAAQLKAQLQSERSSPKADIVLGGSADLHADLAKDGLTEPYPAAGSGEVLPAFRDPNNAWIGFYASALGTLVQRERYRKELTGVDAPEEWDDLLKPAFKGKIVLPSPATTEAGFLFLATQLFRMGKDEAKALDYMKQLHANGVLYSNTEAEALNSLSGGPPVLAVGWSDDALSAVDRGLPIGFTPPTELSLLVGAVSLVKGAPNGGAGRALIDLVMSKDTANQVVVGVGNRLSTVKGVAPPPRRRRWIRPSSRPTTASGQPRTAPASSRPGER